MSPPEVVHCIVDDTVLITNIGEIEDWVSQGAVTLVVPLYTLERLHLLKKDASQIGTNARKAVKFLDRVTSTKEDMPHEPVTLQGPDEQYPTWAEVEQHYNNESVISAEKEELKAQDEAKRKQETEAGSKSDSATGALSQILLDKLNFSNEPAATSPSSTPPTSPSSSAPQSSKTSPEVKSASLIAHDISPVPPTLKPLLNPVVWYTHEKKGKGQENVVFLTNSADVLHLCRDFAVPTKNIHQLRSALGRAADVVKEAETIQRKRPTTPAAAVVVDNEPKPLFKYEEDESDEEEVVFKPKGRGAARITTSNRGSPSTTVRSKAGNARSPRSSFSTPTPPLQNKPQIPTEEIDPDSFDRGSFGRGSTPLVNTGNHIPGQFNGFPRGPSSRGNFTPAGPSRGGFYRGAGRGYDRGSARGRGRLFVP